jgi:hypothetical protein
VGTLAVLDIGIDIEREARASDGIAVAALSSPTREKPISRLEVARGFKNASCTRL